MRKLNNVLNYVNKEDMDKEILINLGEENKDQKAKEAENNEGGFFSNLFATIAKTTGNKNKNPESIPSDFVC